MTLKEARLNAGYTQAELGEMLGLRVVQLPTGVWQCALYSYYEMGRVNMSAACYLKLCELLHVKPGEIDPPCKKIVGSPRGCGGKRTGKVETACRG